MQYRKRPVIVEAMQLDDDADPWMEIARWCNGAARFVTGLNGVEGGLVIRTSEGEMFAGPGDWIIRGVEGEFYPCKPSIFDATYEKVD